MQNDEKQFILSKRVITLTATGVLVAAITFYLYKKVFHASKNT